MRYADRLVRMWVAPGIFGRSELQDRHSAAGDGNWGEWGFENQIQSARLGE
jgi:hypothetical protein